MKAMVLTGPRQMVLQEWPEPEVTRDGVAVKVEAAAICNTTDYRSYAANDPSEAWPSLPYPVVIGHEVCGRIVARGEGVTGWNVGDRISGWGVSHGGYAEYCAVTPDDMAPIRVPESVPAEEASFLELVIGTLRYLATPDGFLVESGQRVAVTGLGPAGLLYLQHALLLGAAEAWVTDRNPARRELARQLGAHQVYDSVEEMVEAAARSGSLFDSILDSTGADLRKLAGKCLRADGAIVPFGLHFDWNALGGAIEGKPFHVAQGGVAEARQVIPRVETWLAEGALRLGPLVSRRIGLAEIPEAIEALQRRPKKMVKVVAIP